MFSWNDIPEKDNKKLQKYLVRDLGVKWAENADINKDGHSKTIYIRKDKNFAKIVINGGGDNATATLEINEYETHKLIVKKDGDNLRIYTEKSSKRIIDEKFIKDWKYYVSQTILATLVIFIVLFVLTLRNAVIVASIGATTYIVFARPDSVTAKPRNIIGGHLIGVFLGSLFSLVPNSSFLASVSIYSIAIGLSIFIMVILDFEHPPASGTTLGVLINGFSFNLAVTVMASAIMLSLAHFFLSPYLKDLT